LDRQIGGLGQRRIVLGLRVVPAATATAEPGAVVERVLESRHGYLLLENR